MKFVAATLLACLAVVTEAARAAKVRRRDRRGGLDKSKIMSKAIPVDKDGNRRLDQQGDFEVDGSYSLQFNTCVSVKVGGNYDDDNGSILFDNNLIRYTQQGSIVAEKSYILFNICPTEYCDYYAESDNLYMVDIATYMASVTEFYTEREEVYCEACQESVSYCSWRKYNGGSGSYNDFVYAMQYGYYGGGEGGEGQNYYQNMNYYNYNNQYQNQYQQAEEDENEDAQDEQEDNGGRKLTYGSLEVIDCDVCEQKNCFSQDGEGGGENNQGQYAQYNENGYYQMAYYSTEDVAEWVEQVGECLETEATFGDYYPLYAGFMCNEAGSGVEIAMFLDEECTTYTSLRSYNQIASNYEMLMLKSASDMITYPFVNDIDCNGEYQVLSVEEYQEAISNYNYEGNEDNDGGEVNEFCQTVMQGGEGGEAMSVRNCGNDENGNGNNGNGNYNYKYAVQEYVDGYYDWYTFKLSYEDSQDNQAACYVVRSMQGEYDSIYNPTGSGSHFDYGDGVATTSSENIRDFFSQYDRMDATLIGSIVVAVALALLACGCILYSCCSAASTPNKYSKEQRDAHRERLVNERTGELM